MSICAECDNARVRDYQAANPEATKQRNAAWRETNLDRHHENNRQWRIKNQDLHRANARQWALDNPVAYRERLRVWRENNPEKAAEYRAKNREANAKREQRRRAALGRPDPATNAYVDVILADPCSYCGSRDSLQVDHIEPVVKGGAGHWSNLTAACRWCNTSKNDDPLLSWLALLPSATRFPMLGQPYRRF